MELGIWGSSLKVSLKGTDWETEQGWRTQGGRSEDPGVWPRTPVEVPGDYRGRIDWETSGQIWRP